MNKIVFGFLLVLVLASNACNSSKKTTKEQNTPTIEVAEDEIDIEETPEDE